MSDYNMTEVAGKTLKRLITENYSTYEEFAYDYGVDVRTVSRYVNEGITKVCVLQELSEFFNVKIETIFIK